MESNTSEFVARVDAGASACEHGDKLALAKVLNAEGAYERAGLARQLQERVNQDRFHNSGLPSLELTIKKDFAGHELLTDIAVKPQQANDQRALTSIYHSNFRQSEYKRPFSFDKEMQTTYETVDPISGKILAEDVSLSDGRTSHNDIRYDLATQKVVERDWKWSNGTTERYSYDDQDHELTSDIEWTANGKRVHRHTDNKYNPVTGKLMISDLSFSDGTKSHRTFDDAGRILTDDGQSSDGKSDHYEARYDGVTGKLIAKTIIRDRYKDSAAYDRVTGQVLSEEMTFSFGLTIKSRYEYDTLTHEKILHERSTTEGEFDRDTFDSHGRPLVSDSRRADGKSAHSEYTYDNSGKLLTSDEHNFNGSLRHEDNTYDSATGHLVTHSEMHIDTNGQSHGEQDLYDRSTGRLKAEDVGMIDGSHQHLEYEYLEAKNDAGVSVVNITEVEAQRGRETRQFDYQFTYKPGRLPDTGVLRVLWRGSGLDGNYTESEMRRIEDVRYLHVPKALQ